MWLTWLADEDTRRRYEALVYRRGPEQCAYWLGAISSTGHGKFRAGSRARARPGAGPSRIVTAHVYAYQLDHGTLPAAEPGRPGGRDPAPVRRDLVRERAAPDRRHPARQRSGLRCPARPRERPARRQARRARPGRSDPGCDPGRASGGRRHRGSPAAGDRRRHSASSGAALLELGGRRGELRLVACTRYIRPIARRDSVSAPGLDRSGLSGSGSRSGGGRGRRGRGAWLLGGLAAPRQRRSRPAAPRAQRRSSAAGGLRGRVDRGQLARADGNDHQVEHRDRPVRLPVRTPRPVCGRGRVQLGPLPLSEPGRVGRVVGPGRVTVAVVARRVIPDKPGAGDVRRPRGRPRGPGTQLRSSPPRLQNAP